MVGLSRSSAWSLHLRQQTLALLSLEVSCAFCVFCLSAQLKCRVICLSAQLKCRVICLFDCGVFLPARGCLALLRLPTCDCTGLPAGWKRGEVLAALLSLLEQRRVRRPLGRRPRSALVSQRRTGAPTGSHAPKATKQGGSGHQHSRRWSRATRTQRTPTGTSSPRGKRSGSGGGELASNTT